MNKLVTIENLEARKLFSAELSIAQRTMYFNAVLGATMTQELRVTNTGDSALVLTGDAFRLIGSARSRFSVAGYDPTVGLGIRPGRTVKFAISYTARATDNLDIKTARLSLQTNVARGSVALRALPTAGIGGANEPSLQKVINLFNLPIKTGDTNPEDYLYGTPGETDEVRIQQLVKAGAGPVSIRPLALFGNDSNPAVRMGIYTPGVMDSFRALWYAPGESAQSVSPIAYGQTQIDPGNLPFGIATQYPNFRNPDETTRIVYSEDGLNSWETKINEQRKMRFFPFIDQNGNRVANAYVVTQEEFTDAYDFQDCIFIITNVKPADGADAVPTLNWENISGLPNNSRLVFNKVEIPDTQVPNVTRTQNTVRLRNTGSVPLTVSLSIESGPFVIDRGGGSNVILAPGATRDVVVRFNASSGQRVYTGNFRINSNDPNQPTVTIALAGYWQQYSEFPPGQPGRTLEPTAQQIVNQVFGYTTILTNPGQRLKNGGRLEATGDEVLSSYWRAADDNAPVRAQILASYHGQFYLAADGVTVIPAQTFLQWYTKGNSAKNQAKTILKHAKAVGQMMLPFSSDSKKRNVVAAGAFNPRGEVFGFLNESNEYSDPALNVDPVTLLPKPGFGHFLRFFPTRDADGVLIPNSYIMLQDYNRTFTNFDYQDNVFLISNIVPENSLKSPQTVFAEDTSRGARLAFTSPSTGPKVLGFNVYRSATPRGTYELLTGTPLSARPVTVFVDESVSPGQTFYYEIRTVGAGGKQSDPVMVRV